MRTAAAVAALAVMAALTGCGSPPQGQIVVTLKTAVVPAESADCNVLLCDRTSSVAGEVVLVQNHDGSIAAQQRLDAGGEATFVVAPGQYLVRVQGITLNSTERILTVRQSSTTLVQLLIPECSAHDISTGFCR